MYVRVCVLPSFSHSVLRSKAAKQSALAAKSAICVCEKKNCLLLSTPSSGSPLYSI